MEEKFSGEKGDISDEATAEVDKDIISKLPDSLILQILSYLRTKEVVSTSSVSKRWEGLWLLISGLDLNTSEFPDYDTFVSFMNRVLDFLREHKLCLEKLKLSIPGKDTDFVGCIDSVDMSKRKLSFRKGENGGSCLTRWIDFVARSKLKQLHIDCPLAMRGFLEEMPLSLYVCKSLLYLRLHRVLLGKFETVSLPRLKDMTLELNVYADEASLELLISSCPVLEDLNIVRRSRDNAKVLRVNSQTLTRLLIVVDERHDAVESRIEEFDYENSGILIDAPGLKCLKFCNEVSESKTISNSGSLVRFSVDNSFRLKNRADDADLRKRYMVGNFFTTISGVKDMRISYDAYKVYVYAIHTYM